MSNEKTKRRLRSSFSYVTEAGSVLAMVFSYLNGELSEGLSQREGKHRATDAMLAFWKPFALQESHASSEVVKRAAAGSVEALRRQIQLICDEFDLEPPIAPRPSEMAAIVTAVCEQLGRSPASSQPEGSVNLESGLPAKPTLSTEDMIFVDDADLLGNLE